MARRRRARRRRRPVDLRDRCGGAPRRGSRVRAWLSSWYLRRQASGLDPRLVLSRMVDGVLNGVGVGVGGCFWADFNNPQNALSTGASLNFVYT